MKVAGSSVEVALTPFCGPEDILTGTHYADEAFSNEIDYPERNNSKTVRLSPSDAIAAFKSRGIARVPGYDGKSFVNLKSYKFHTHSSPACLANICADEGPTVRDYYRFTISRNPWDLIVSYYWWTFYTPPVIAINDSGGYATSSQSGEFSPNGTMGYMAPFPGDSPEELKRKLQAFLTTHSTFYGQSGVSENTNILDWFANTSREFYSDEIDFTIRYENIQEDFDLACDQLDVPKSNLPMIKSNIRKSKMHYREYYNSFTRDLVFDNFQDIVNKFYYDF
jgi:hypothetical protein